MKRTLAKVLFSTALALILTVTLWAQSQLLTNPANLSQFPSVERIKAGTKGTDEVDSHARFMAALELINWMIVRDLVKAPNGGFYDVPRTAERVQDQYFNALTKFRIDEPPPASRDPRYGPLESKYEKDPVFFDNLLTQFFSPKFRSDYYAWIKKPVPQRTPGPGGPRGASPDPQLATSQPTTRPTAPGTPTNGSVNDLITQGDKYSEAKDYAKAVEAYKKAIAIQPSAAGAYSRLGNNYLYLGKYSEALAAHRQADRIAPNEAVSHFNIGRVYRAMEQYENAIASFREALRLKPDYAPAFNQIGLTHYYNMEKFPEAAAALQQAARLAPDNASYLLNLGNAYIDMRRKADALQIYQKLQKIDQAKAKELNDHMTYLNYDDPQVFLTMGIISLEDQNNDGALRAYHHVIALKPTDPAVLATAHNGRGQAFVGLKKYEKAVAEYREAIRLHPKEPGYYLNLGTTYLAMGQKDQALQVYRTLQRLDREKAQELYAEINKSK